MSYFNTKRGFTSTSLNKVASSTEGVSIDSSTKFDEEGEKFLGDFFNGLRQELKECVDENVK